MSLAVAALEHGLVRVFRLSPALSRLLEQTDDLVPLEQALGVIIAKPEDVQIIAAETLSDMSLSQFLTMAYGVDEAMLVDVSSALNDTFAIIRSGAFGGEAMTFKDTSDARLLQTFPEEGATLPTLTPLTAETAKGEILKTTSVKKPKSDARVGGMVATVALLIMGLLVWLMIWIAS